MSDYIYYGGELYHFNPFHAKDGKFTSGAKAAIKSAGKAYRKHHRVIGGVGSALTKGGASGVLRAVQGGGKGREKRLEKKLANSGDKMSDKQKANIENKLQAQKKANADRAKYDAQISTGKMVVQDALFGYYGAEKYRNARARGASRLRSLFETNALLPLNAYLRYSGNKKAYGDGMVAGVDNGDNFYY